MASRLKAAWLTLRHILVPCCNVASADCLVVERQFDCGHECRMQPVGLSAQGMHLRKSRFTTLPGGNTRLPGLHSTARNAVSCAPAGVVAGAVVGTVAGVALLLAAAWLISYRRRRKYSPQNPFAPSKPWSCLDRLLGLPPALQPVGPILSTKESLNTPDGPLKHPGSSSSSSMQAKHRKPGPASKAISQSDSASSTARDLMASDVHMPSDVIGAGLAARRGAMCQGFTGDELQAGISDLRYIITNALLPAVDNAPLAAGEPD